MDDFHLLARLSCVHQQDGKHPCASSISPSLYQWHIQSGTVHQAGHLVPASATSMLLSRPRLLRPQHLLPTRSCAPLRLAVNRIDLKGLGRRMPLLVVRIDRRRHGGQYGAKGGERCWSQRMLDQVWRCTAVCALEQRRTLLEPSYFGSSSGMSGASPSRLSVHGDAASGEQQSAARSCAPKVCMLNSPLTPNRPHYLDSITIPCSHLGVQFYFSSTAAFPRLYQSQNPSQP